MSFLEITVILIVALLVFGPERLPQLIRMILRLYQKLQDISQEVQQAAQTELREHTLTENKQKADLAAQKSSSEHTPPTP